MMGPRRPLLAALDGGGEEEDPPGVLEPAEALGRAACAVDRQAELVEDVATATFLRRHAADLRLEAFGRTRPSAAVGP